MDPQKLRTLVFEKTGIKIDTTDPVFALVALNESVLEEALQRHLAALQQAHLVNPPPVNQPAYRHRTDNWESDEPAPASAAPGSAGLAADAALAAAASAASSAAAPILPETVGTVPPAPLDRRLLLGAAATSLCSALLVLTGQALWGWMPPKPTPSAPPNVQQKPQAQPALPAEKLARALEKLDPKSRAIVQAELDKP